jgi:hypothetical protein
VTILVQLWWLNLADLKKNMSVCIMFAKFTYIVKNTQTYICQVHLRFLFKLYGKNTDDRQRTNVDENGSSSQESLMSFMTIGPWYPLYICFLFYSSNSLYSIKILTTELSAKIQDWLVWRNLYDFKNVEDDSPII